MDGKWRFDAERDFAISQQACEWTMRALAALEARLNLNITMHAADGQLERGQIFLFNHFARFETFIPNYIIKRETGADCRSVASRDLFRQDNPFSRYLLSLGAVPNSYPRLLPFLAEEILRGRKVVIFPEGGLVKDRHVVGEDGKYLVYSRTARTHRKHHAGAAALALTLDAFKTGILQLVRRSDRAQLERWRAQLGLESVEDLVAACRKPTEVVPSNITFYPIRVEPNLLGRAADVFVKGIPPQFAEELLIEGNLLLRETDMDIRLGPSIHTSKSWSWLERKLLGRAVRRVSTLDDLFAATSAARDWRERVVRICIRNHVDPMRDAYMAAMYAEVSINLCHLASRLIMMLVERGRSEIDRQTFRTILYLAVKNAQTMDAIHLHRGLENPDAYEGLIEGRCEAFTQFIDSTVALGLIERDGPVYRFLPKLREQVDFETIRLENPIAVYANEMAPIRAAWQALEQAQRTMQELDDRRLAMLAFDDELRSLDWDRRQVAKPVHETINAQETATADPAPYLLVPGGDGNRFGVLMVHGFLASPAELREFGEELFGCGHPVMGVRLKGHGTSPHDLRDRHWEDWLASVRRGYDILSAFCDRICIVGFSTGGALALILATERPEKLAGVAVASTALRYHNKTLVFVPLLHGANKLMDWVPTRHGVIPFRRNESEQPEINYRHIPIEALYELGQALAELNGRLKMVDCPVLVLQGDGDRIVDPHSAEMIMRRLRTPYKKMHMLRSDRHGILSEDVDNARAHVLSFIARLRRGGAARLEEVRPQPVTDAAPEPPTEIGGAA